MLVTFKTSVHADITLFGDVAEALLKMMGLSGTVPSALLADGIDEAITQLRSNLKMAATAQAEAPSKDDEDGDDDEANRVALSTRAIPLLELLEAASSAKSHVTWDH